MNDRRRWFYCTDCTSTWFRASVYRRDELCPRCKHNGATLELYGAAAEALEAVQCLKSAGGLLLVSLEDANGAPVEAA
jgi:hypothetical protein